MNNKTFKTSVRIPTKRLDSILLWSLVLTNTEPTVFDVCLPYYRIRRTPVTVNFYWKIMEIATVLGRFRVAKKSRRNNVPFDIRAR